MRDRVYVVLAHVRDSDPARPGYDVPAFSRAWRSRGGAEAARDALVDAGTPYAELSIVALTVED